jgi:hypothetical protein
MVQVCMVRNLTLIVLLLCCSPLHLLAQENRDFQRGLEARRRGDLQSAVRHFQSAVEADPRVERHGLALGETLGWMEDFEEAERVYRALLERFPRSVEGRLGLGEILLWRLRLADAEAVFHDVLLTNPGELRALEGVARALYWGGDWRGARTYARRALSIDPRREEALRIDREIAEVTAPAYTVATTFVSDDQPYRLLHGLAGIALHSDPLTKWELSGGSYLLESGSRSASSPFVELAGSTRLPALDLGVEARVRALEFPDGENEILPSLRASWHRPAGIFAISWERSELLRTLSAIDDHPSVDSFGIRWSREREQGWNAAVSARQLRYFDDNRGIGADGWFLARPLELGGVKISYGPAISYRDTDESRFVPVAGGDGFYEPYWTPERLLEIRAVVQLAAALGRMTLLVHADGGWGREEVSPQQVTREFHPWRARVGTDFPAGGRARVHLGLEQEKTAFWEATTFHATVAGRF